MRPHLFSGLRADEWERLRELVGSFEQAWQRALPQGGSVDLHGYLPVAKDPMRAPVLAAGSGLGADTSTGRGVSRTGCEEVSSSRFLFRHIELPRPPAQSPHAAGKVGGL